MYFFTFWKYFLLGVDFGESPQWTRSQWTRSSLLPEIKMTDWNYCDHLRLHFNRKLFHRSPWNIKFVMHNQGNFKPRSYVLRSSVFNSSALKGRRQEVNEAQDVHFHRNSREFREARVKQTFSLKVFFMTSSRTTAFDPICQCSFALNLNEQQHDSIQITSIHINGWYDCNEFFIHRTYLYNFALKRREKWCHEAQPDQENCLT